MSDIADRNRQYALLSESKESLMKKTYKVMYKPNIDSDWVLGIDCGRDREAAIATRNKWLRGRYCFDVCIQR